MSDKSSIFVRYNINYRETDDEPLVKSKFVCKLLLGTCGAKGCLASLS